MAIGGPSVPDTVQLKHWQTLVPDTRAAQRLLVREMASMAERIGGEADALLTELHGDGISHDILKTVRSIIETRATHIQQITDMASAKACSLRIVTAESCTGGALATLLSDVEGAGEVLEGGFVSYAKSFKSQVLERFRISQNHGIPKSWGI